MPWQGTWFLSHSHSHSHAFDLRFRFLARARAHWDRASDRPIDRSRVMQHSRFRLRRGRTRHPNHSLCLAIPSCKSPSPDISRLARSPALGAGIPTQPPMTSYIRASSRVEIALFFSILSFPLLGEKKVKPPSQRGPKKVDCQLSASLSTSAKANPDRLVFCRRREDTPARELRGF